MNDVFIYHSPDPHTAVPDWVALHPGLLDEERNLLHLILVGMKRSIPPTQDELAQQSRVHSRTVARRLVTLRERGFIETYRAGRRTFYRLKAAKPDTMGITDPHAITDPHGVTYRQKSSHQSSEQQEAINSGFSENPITDRAGGGGGSDSRDEDPPPATAPRRKISPSEITGATGRWMVAEGFSLTKAHQYQDLPLAPAQADYQRRRQLGQGMGAIALAWEVAPPAGESSSVPLEPSTGAFTFSEHEKERYRAMGFAFGSDPIEESEESA